jgi:uncharacterized protein Yka (UPF0111/DUF47 family)
MNDSKPSLLRRLLDRVFPRAPDFYRLLNEQCDLAVETMQTFAEYMQDGDPEKGSRVRALEHQGDDLKRRNTDELNRSFSTPMDREDILRAVVSIDDIVGYAKTTVREMEILEVTPDPPMQQMATLLLEGTVSLQRGYAKLGSKPLDSEADAQYAHKTERKVEKVYRRAVAELFDEQRITRLAESEGCHAAAEALVAVVRMLRRRELYRHLSNAADRIDCAGEVLHDIVVKIA